jgi:hypothetical protein
VWTPPDAVAQRAAHHAHRRAHQRGQHGELPGLDLADLELVVEVGGQEAGQADEAAEGDDVDQAEGPAVLLEQAADVLAKALVLDVRRLLGHQRHHQHGQQHGGGGDAVHGLPAELLRQRRREQHGQHGAAVAGAGNAHGQALVLGRVPARTQRQRHAEAGAGDAQQHAHGQHRVVAVDQEEAEAQRRDDQRHLHQRGVLAPDVLRQHAERETHQRTGQDGHRDHETLLCRRQAEALADEGRHGAVQHPDGKAEVEVEEGGEQGGPVAGLGKGLEGAHGWALVTGRLPTRQAWPLQRKPRARCIGGV